MEHTIIDMAGKILTPMNHLSSLTRRTAHKLVKIIKNKHHKWQPMHCRTQRDVGSSNAREAREGTGGIFSRKLIKPSADP